VAPANTVAASVSGSAVAGQTLAADPGTWSGTPAPTLTYQWQRCSDSGDLGTCSDIGGAIDSTYVLVDPDDVAAFVRVVVTATNDSGGETSTSDVTAAVAATPVAPAGPANTVAASISGSAVAGQILTADPGTWTGTPAPTLTYQWQRCSDSGDLGTCSDIADATAGTYLLVDPDDVGGYLRAVVTATNATGAATSTSGLTAAVVAAPAAPANLVAASVSGSTVAGETLAADPGTWSGTPAPTLTYEWQRCSDSGDPGTCSDIDGATDSTYVLVDPDDVGSYLRVVVTAANGSGSDTSTSELTDQVAGS
jgi:rRNA processing protein Gar1